MSVRSLFGADHPGSGASWGRPNIILILADDLGYGDLGCFGQTRIKTPNLDALAAGGMRLTSFYAGSAMGGPSRCALMTGQHTGHGFIRGGSEVPLPAEAQTFPQMLKRQGYATGLIGKWGLGIERTTGTPDRKGFDDYLGFLSEVQAHNYYPDFIWRHDSHSGFDGKRPVAGNENDQKGVYIQDLFTVAAGNFIRFNRPTDSNGQRPFFLYLAYTTPHANNEEGKRSGNGMQVPSDVPYSGEAWPQVQKNKAAMITRLDQAIGQIVNKLKSEKLEQNTLILFSSDNGPHAEGGVSPEFFRSSGPFRGIKGDLYEGGIRVPTIISWPGRIRAASESDLPLAFWDVYPTFAEIAGAKAPSLTDGISFAPILFGMPQTNRHSFLYWELHERGFQQAVRMGEWKGLKLSVEAEPELYNLSSDPGEKTNVAAMHPEIVAQMGKIMIQEHTEPGSRHGAKN